MAFSYGDYNDELDHTLKAEEENTNSLFLFANNNTGTAENLSYYRLYDMKIEGDSQGVTEGIDYVDCLISDGASYIDTGIIPTLDMTFYGDYTITKPGDVAFGSSESIKSYGIYQSANRLYYGGYTNITGYSLSSYGNRYQNTLTPTGYILTDVTLGKTVSGDYTHTPSGTYTHTMRLFGEPRNVDGMMYYAKCKIYEFKIYNAENNLIRHLRPCLDTSKVPCMYDEVTKRYFYNRGTGTFGYKKKLRDFQPVLDKNNVPCLMDKINRKYYYAKNGKTFNCREQIGYRGVSYLQGDGASYINTNIIPDSNTKVVVDAYSSLNDCFNGVCLFGATDSFLSYSFQTSAKWLYVGKLGVKHTVGGNSLDESIFVGKHIITIDLSDTVNVINVDGIDYGENTGTTTGCTTPILLFNRYDAWESTSIDKLSTAKIYSFKIYQSDELVFDGIPALDTNNVPCLYDKVSEQLFYNQGTGEFSYGIEELECPPANYAEYMDNNSSVFKLDVSRNPGELIGVKYKFMFTDKTPNTTNTSILCTTNGREGSSGWIYFTPSIGGTNFETRMGFGDGNHVFTSTIPFERNKEYEIEFDATDSKFRVNGVEMADTNTNPSASSRGYDLYLFTNTINYAISDMRLYYVDIYKNHELVGSYRPCLDEDGNICLYNSVNKKYIYKDNSETPTIENPRYTPITYIESNGTQYIDTGVVPTDNTDINMVCRSTNVTPYIKDGLILNLDGINNTMISHNSSTTVWEDLSGNGLNFNLNNITINDDSMSFNGTTSYANIQDIELWKTIANNTTEYDVELCFKFNNGESYQPIISSNYGLINVAKFIKYLQFKSTNFGLNLSSILGGDDWSRYDKFTISCNMNALLGYFNTTNYTLESTNDSITPPTSDNFSIGTRLTGESYWFCGDIYSIRIYNRHLTNEERLYNHSVDVKRFDVTTDVMTISTDNYIMNGLVTDNTYKYNAIDTTVEPNLTASAGATLTLGATNLAYLTEEEIEQATNDGWTLE